MPKISVILTSFNHEKFIREAIDSVLNQTFTDFELIIWDDASTDGSWEVINSYSDSRIKAFRNEVSKRGVYGINKSISEIATGEYIAIHHSDDVWELDKLEKQVKFLDSNPEIGAVFSNALAIDELGIPLADTSHFYYNIFNQPNRSRHKWLNYFFFNGNVLCHPSILIRKSCYKDCGLYRIGLAQVGDFDMWVRLCAKHEIHVMAESLIKFRVRDDELNSSGNRIDTRIRSAYELYKVLQLYKKIVSKHDVFKIFPELIKYDCGESTDAEYVLARACLEVEPFFLRQLLAVEILFDILNDLLRRQAVEATYGFSIKDYVALTGQHDIFLHEVNANLLQSNTGLSEVNANLLQSNTGLSEVNADLLQTNTVLSEANADLLHSNTSLLEVNANLLQSNTGLSEVNANLLQSNTGLSEVNADLLQTNTVLSEANADLLHSNTSLSEENASQLQLNTGLSEANTNLLITKAELNHLVAIIHKSRSWRLTAPLRFASSAMTKVRNTLILFIKKSHSILCALPKILQKGGGIWPTLCTIIRVLRINGYAGIRLRLRLFFIEQAPISVTGDMGQPNLLYIDQKLDSSAVASNLKASVAVHLHLYHSDTLTDLVAYLNNIPFAYDLYVSAPETYDLKLLKSELKTVLFKIKDIFVESVPNIGGDIAPLIIQFGERLMQYKIIAHIHSKNLEFSNNLDAFSQDVLSNIMGFPASSGGRIAHIIELLQANAKIIFSEVRTEFIDNGSGWLTSEELAKKLLKKYTQFSINDFPTVEFPESTMFWTRTDCLKDFLKLPINYSDFSSNQVLADDMLVNALQRLMLMLASKHEGECVQIRRGDSIQSYPFYEEQQDYSLSISYSNIKVLSYYLPQFHPIPENDLWHGKGFTEWTKVSSSNPLFEGHYQQHIPHSDIGYYLLDSADTLKMQAEMMQKAGVHGQVFYHYWFSGKLILEEPAQLLLNTPDIKMPFCFCWANENWTRRWDGNEKEILLGQKYSTQDAHDFIQYLIPFFKDPRYIKVEERPVLFVYRPSSIPSSQEYLDIWESECAKFGIKRPYVVAILTRGATNPKEFGMDAGVERVLHDWTEGAAPEIKNSLNQYKPINGSVLSYNDVANFYTKQTDTKDFTYFRSLVPIWDNTARYGSEAYVVHGSTPQRFQEWMESTLAYTQTTLPVDRQFVLINAWNEWAEGAHLEPDTRYGYSYLNSVGRALAGISYPSQLNKSISIPSNTKIHLSLSKFCLNQLESDSTLKQRFVHCLSQSSVFKTCLVSMNDAQLMQNSDIKIQSDSEDVDYTLEFRKVMLFNSTAIEKMLLTACASKSAVVANSYDGNSPLTEVASNGSVHTFVAYTAPMLMQPMVTPKSGYKSLQMRTDARVFAAYPSEQSNTIRPEVTTIIRFHKSADFNELENALYCLYAMQDCNVIPLIAAQDLSHVQVERLKTILNSFTWAKGCEPQVYYYESQNGQGDLRAKMLNESIKKVSTRYATFLDYDDLIMPHAYGWLVNRLQITGKAVSFGRIWSTSYNGESCVLLQRERTFECGYSYDDFVSNNHAPLHSFMIDLEKIDLSSVIYFEGQRFMEDYLLTLQLFTKDNCDWASLVENQYIGDYIHSVDRPHTLAISDDQERKALLSNPEYMACEQRICDMRERL